jgi:hypothetical protein
MSRQEALKALETYLWEHGKPAGDWEEITEEQQEEAFRTVDKLFPELTPGA